jgi:hypothetical protein
MEPFQFRADNISLAQFWRLLPTRKIDAIKLLREASDMGLKDAKDTVEALRGERPISGEYRPIQSSADLEVTVSQLRQELENTKRQRDANANEIARLRRLANKLYDFAVFDA